jgi:hypothetical protein
MNLNTLFVSSVLQVLPVLAKKENGTTEYIHSNFLGSFQSKIQSSHLLYVVKKHHIYFTYNVTVLVFTATSFIVLSKLPLPFPTCF